MSMDRGMDKEAVEHIQMMEYYSVMKRNAFESVLMRCVNLQRVIQSELSQKEKQVLCISARIGEEFGSDGTESACNAGDLGSVPMSGRSPGGGHGNPLQYPSLENPTDGGAQWARVHGVAESDTAKYTHTDTVRVYKSQTPNLSFPQVLFHSLIRYTQLPLFVIFMGFSGGSDGKEAACQCRKPRFDLWVRKIPWRRAWRPTPGFLPGASHMYDICDFCSVSD